MNWQIKSLDEVCIKITDGAHQSPKTVDSGKPMASVKDLTRFGVDLREARKISVEDFERLVKQGCQPQVGDVLIAKDGNSALDTVCNIKQPLEAVLLSSVAILRPNFSVLDSDFLKFYLSSKDVVDYFKNNFISGAAIPRVVLRDFRKAQIHLPELKTQKQIAKILGDLDDKIHLNNQINQTLESIAQAIFKSWFIDFEPVRAKIAAKLEGADPELAAMCAISGKSEAELEQMAKDDFAELQATAVLFPDELVETELGEVPRGWSIAKVDDILNRIKIKKRFKKNDVNEFGRTFVLEQGSNIILGFHNDEGSIPASKEEPVFIFGDHTCITKLMLSNFDVSENVIAVTGKERNSYWTYYAIRDLQKFQEYRRHWMELVSKQVVMADLNLTDYFAKKVKTLHEEIENFVHENLVLINLRDTLLPKLLSGEVEVSDLQGEVT
ncbi:hypothetical protein F900_02725 [Acinetobacter modestus]|uniref:Type I restriction modification DNA specificity domain-containing protein n=1 Tax=Acinetobacter modestus TaxID=1776740 RepID=N9N0M4_9GAMM|nr:restriction endonuclease subunit S [Acinetobacter modestus]ENW99040.1 hypothetical protein F900_02725 [Acinetobacter modestus]